MSKIQKLIEELCPEGVQFKSLGEICTIETGRLNASEGSVDGRYTFFTTAKTPSRIDSYRWDTEALLIAGNANVGNVQYFKGKFEAYQRTYVLTEFPLDLNVRFLYFALRNSLDYYLNSNKNVAAMTYIVLSTLENFNVPLPPIKVQGQIVSILEKFTDLEAELEAELVARAIQYENSLNRIFNFSGLENNANTKQLESTSKSEISLVRLSELVRRNSGMQITAGQMKVIGSKGGDTRIFAGGATYVDTDSSSVPEAGLLKGPLVIVKSRGNIGFEYWEGKCSHKSELWSYSPRSERLEIKFLYYFLQTQQSRLDSLARSKSVKMPQLSVGDTDNMMIPLPTIELQRKIVKSLDKLSDLVSSVGAGLPAEITARRQQYEYYRNKLLTFKELKAS